MIIVTILIILFAAIHIFAEYQKRYQVIYMAKPLTVLLIIFSFIKNSSDFRLFHFLMVIGFSFSLVGDIFLMLRNEKFVQGLFSFLMAHIFFSSAFYQLISTISWTFYLIPLIFLDGVIYFYLRKGLKSYNIPVVLYMVGLSLMVYVALLTAIEIPSPASHWILSGAISFMCSDCILAINKFKKPFKPAQAIVLSTYYFALVCFANGASLL